MPYKDPTSGDLSKRLTVKQAAAKLGLSYKVVLGLVHDGRISTVKIKKRHFIALEALDALLVPESRATSPAAPAPTPTKPEEKP